MKNTRSFTILVLGVLGLGAVILAAAGCSSSPATSADSQPKMLSSENTKPGWTGKGRAQMWAENCNRCHNYRPASSYTAAQWETIMLHMRVRAPLTQEEYEGILEFLKASR